MKNFDDAFETLIGHEGGYSNNIKDPGGETMYGVTLRVARANGYAGSMRDLPLAKAKVIAKAEYWNKVRGDDIDPNLAFQLFDVIYNGGHPIEWLQKAIGVVADGSFGPATLAAIKNAPIARTIMLINAYRLQYYCSLNGWETFGKGWSKRVANNLIIAANP